MYMYDRPAWTGEVYETECFFPTWINKESAAHVQALADAHKALWGDKRIGHADDDPKYDAMHLRQAVPSSTSGRSPPTASPFRAATASPAWASAPARRAQAHAPNEITWKQDLVTCAALYAAGSRPVQDGNQDRGRHRVPPEPYGQRHSVNIIT